MVAAIATLVYITVTEDARMATMTNAQLARRIENGAELFHRNCITCHGEKAEGIPGLCPPLNSLTLLQQRVKDTGWSGSVHSYIVSTISAGRLYSTRPDQFVGRKNEGMAMPFWSQVYGGPLRVDQVEDIALYLENFGDVPVATGPTPTPAPLPDDPIEAGLVVYQANACASCHQLDLADAVGAVGPTHNGLGETAAQRIEDPSYTGEATTPEEYIEESILNSAAHVVEGYGPVSAMPSYPNLSEEQLDALVQMLMQQ